LDSLAHELDGHPALDLERGAYWVWFKRNRPVFRSCFGLADLPAPSCPGAGGLAGRGALGAGGRGGQRGYIGHRMCLKSKTQKPEATSNEARKTQAK
jgi:hypothetical protein